MSEKKFIAGMGKEGVKREKQLREQLFSYDISPNFLDAVKDYTFNTSAFAPYHNYQHLYSVTLNTIRAIRQAETTFEYKQGFILGALFHDANHTLNPKLDDDANIAESVKTLAEALVLIQPEFSGRVQHRIAQDSIKQTRFPYFTKVAHYGHRVIREADLLQYAEPDWLEWLKGYNVETGQNVSVEDTRKFLLSNAPLIPENKDKLSRAEIFK